jgi:hypothetical protein
VTPNTERRKRVVNQPVTEDLPRASRPTDVIAEQVTLLHEYYDCKGIKSKV